MRNGALFLLAVLLAGPALADVRTYRVAQTGEGPGITTKLSYTFGVHENHVSRATGEVRFDPAAPRDVSGTLAVPIDALVSDDAERDCHMREALGLDYGRSQYPKEHVCRDDRLPAGAVAFPEILLRVRGGTADPLSPGKESPVTLDADWTIHGVTRPARLQLTASPDATTPGAVRIRGTSTVRLSDFGIVVKSAQALFVTVSVGDSANVQFDLKLVPAP